MNILKKWFGNTQVVPDQAPVEIQTAEQARRQTAWHKAQIDDDIAAMAQAAIQKDIDHWEKNFNFFIQHGVKGGKIGGIIDRLGQPQLHPQLIQKFEAHGFHIHVDNQTYGYTDIVIINWELERPNFYDVKDWSRYWMQIGTTPPPNHHFD